jgi:hypothetical protein
MTSNEIFEVLTRILGPFKRQPQNDQPAFQAFEDLLKQFLTQPSIELRSSDVRFSAFQQDALPEEIVDEIGKMTDEIVVAQAARKPADPVFWLRQRSLPITAGVDESLENFVESELSFGPFLNQQSQPGWFDFFLVPKQVRIEVFDSGIPELLVITIPGDQELPAAGKHDTLHFDDCTVWIAVKSIVQNGDNRYVGLRAKHCAITYPGTASVQTPGFVTIRSPTFEISFEPFDKFANGLENDAVPKAGYPEKIIFSFTGTKFLMQSPGEASVFAAGDTITFDAGADVAPVYLEAERLVHFPLSAQKDVWQSTQNNTQTFQLNGQATFTDSGWYLPVASTDNALNTAGLGMSIFSGYLGLRGKEGIAVTWPILENGNIKINKFLLLGRPGRTRLTYTYTALSKTKQTLSVWKSKNGSNDRNLINLKPLLTGDGVCIDDNQQMESLLQPVSITGRVDRPLNTNEKQFEVDAGNGVVLFTKIKADTSVLMIGNHIALPPAQQNRRVPQSICLRNALLTTDNPKSIFIEGYSLVNGVITSGIVHFIFPVYRVVNSLPDPYISNQDDLFEPQAFIRFTNLWREGKDTLTDPVLFPVISAVQWDDVATSITFRMNQPSLINRLRDLEIARVFLDAAGLCGEPVPGLNKFNPGGGDLATLIQSDTENLVGAYDYLKLLPGNRCLVDVSDSANRWGVSFSTNVSDDKKLLVDTLGFPTQFPFRIKEMDLVSSGRLSRLFTLPHIQWEPVMKIENPAAKEPGLLPIISFNNNGNPTRISSAAKAEVALIPSTLYSFILEAFHNVEKPRGIAANFTLPFGICAFAYFNPKKIGGLPLATVATNEPRFVATKTGDVNGAMQLHMQATEPAPSKIKTAITAAPYFIGTATLVTNANDGNTSILGQDISISFAEFSVAPLAKVPLQRVDFSGYGASIFSNWQNEQANFGRVNQVKFDVLIGRTAHEVVQIKSILFPWGVPVVRSIVIQRKNSGIVTRHDSGWIAQGPGEFDFRSHKAQLTPESNPYSFHPGLVTGIYNVTAITELPREMDIPFATPKDGPLILSAVYFNGDIEIENIIRGGLPGSDKTKSRVHSAGQLGYVMLAKPPLVTDKTTLPDIFKPQHFKELLNHSRVGGSLGGPVNAVMNIAGSGQRMHITRVDVSASNEANPSFVVAVRGTMELPKEGSWTVVKTLPSKDVIPLSVSEQVPVVRNGALTIGAAGIRKVATNNSRHCIGDPAEIDKYIGNAVPALQYGLLQTTGTQKILFRRPSFQDGKAQLFSDVPDLADAFRLLNNNSIFPNLSKTLSLPTRVDGLNIIGDGNGFQFDEALFAGADSLSGFVPKQLALPIPDAQTYKLLDESGFQVFISYQSKEKKGDIEPPPLSIFKVDLNSEAIDEAIDDQRRKWQTVNKDVAIVVNLGTIKPLLTLRGQFRSEAGMDPVFEHPECELGPELDAVKDILQVLGTLAGKGDVVADSLKVVMGNAPNVWSYKMGIEQRIPVIQFPGTEEITLTTPPPLIIEASLLLGVFFNLSLSPDPKNLIKPGAGAFFGFEGMIQIQIITIGIAAAYGVGITKVKAYVDLTDPKPQFEFTFGFGATVIVDLPVVGLASVTRSFSLGGNINSGHMKVVAGQMLRGVLSLAGGLLIVAIQIEGSAGVERNTADPDDQSTVAIFQMIFSLDVSLAFVISYDFSKPYTERITLS